MSEASLNERTILTVSPYASDIEVAQKELLALNLRGLDHKGLGRWDEEYYLIGLYHPLRSMSLADSSGLEKSLASQYASMSNEVDIYIHVPFCHINCSFCHFYKEIISRNNENSQESIYIEAILKEIENYTSLMDGKPAPRSIQFGGGTPSAMSTSGLKMLLDGLSRKLDMGECQEIKFEFHPDMHNNLDEYRQKIRALKKFGLTTAIIDIEATDAKILKNICRGNTSAAGYIDLIKIAKEEGVESVASAFMTGLPYETPETFAETLHFLTSIENLDAINIYPLMFKPSDAVFQQRRREPEIFSSPSEKDLMLIMAGQILNRAGFVEGPSHFFTRKNHRPEQQYSKANSSTLLGLGPASFGYIDLGENGLQYMNYPDLKRYAKMVFMGKSGQWRHSYLSSHQVSLRKIVFALNSFQLISTEQFEEASHARPQGELQHTLKKLVQLELLEKNSEGIKLSRKGQLRNSETLYYLCEREVMRWEMLDPEYDLLRRYEFFPNISKDNELLFDKYLEKKKTNEH